MDEICGYKVHPAAAELPLMSEPELAELAEDIRLHGQEDPVIRSGAVIIDGRNRLLACERLGGVPIFEEWEGTEDQIADFIISKNLARRHLTQDQKAIIALRIRGHEAKAAAKERLKEAAEATNRKRAGTPSAPGALPVEETISAPGIPSVPRKAVEEVAKKGGVGARTVERAQRVMEQAPERAEDVLKGRATLKQVEKEIRKRAQLEQIREYRPPEGEYPVIVADPAWPYEDQLDGSEAVRGGTPYPQAPLDEICAQVPPAAKDAVLFLWCTNQHLIDLEAPVQQVLRAWGFTPKALITWKKPRMGLGRYVRNITEQCVIAVRGRPVLDTPSATSWLEAPAGEHSQKPDEFYDLAAKLCPMEPRLELNAREPREGWVTSGAELPATIKPGVCVGCGCTDDRACDGGCSWLNMDRTHCSACFEVDAEDELVPKKATPATSPAKGQWRRDRGTAHWFAGTGRSVCGHIRSGTVELSSTPPVHEQCMKCRKRWRKDEDAPPPATDDGTRCGIRERGRGDPCILDQGHGAFEDRPLHSTGHRTWREPKPKLRKCAAPHCKEKTTSELCDQHSAAAHLAARRAKKAPAKGRQKAPKRKEKRS